MRKSERTVNFTKAAIEAISLPQSGRDVWHDERQPSLTLRISSTGSRVWYLYRRHGGRVERVRIGPYPTTTIDQARQAVIVLMGRAAQGVNPGDARRAARDAPTLAEAYAAFMDLPTRGRAKRPKSDATRHGYEYLWNAHLAEFGSRRINTITRQEVEKLHNRLAKGAPYLANRVLSLLKAIFNASLDSGAITSNPITRLRPYAEQSRDRFLQTDEFPRFWAALEAEENYKLRAFFKLCLFTGARRSNVLAMRWEDVHLDRGVWEIPKTKTGRQSVPLIGPALEVLRELRGVYPGPWVFPGRHDGHLVDPYAAWRAVLARAGLSGLRVHDLRRSMGSWAAKTGASLSVIGKALGHARVETTAIYARLDDDPVRQAMSTAAAAMLAAANKTD